MLLILLSVAIILAQKEADSRSNRKVILRPARRVRYLSKTPHLIVRFAKLRSQRGGLLEPYPGSRPSALPGLLSCRPFRAWNQRRSSKD